VDLRENLRSLAVARFLDLFGVADLEVVRRAEPDALDLLPAGFTRAVVFGLPLQDAAVESVTDRPNPLYFHNYRQANYQLDSAALEAAAIIQSAGFRSLAVAASQLISREPMRAHVSHRLLGWAAGLGWRGRNNLLVAPRFGSRFRLVSVLTDAPLAADSPVQHDCGSCTACVSVCPASAIDRDPAKFNLDACYRKLCEFTQIPFVGQHICGVCVAACRGNPKPETRMKGKPE
jgi:epoxyqueuosine reductase QueG